MDPTDSLDRNDAYHFFKTVGGLIHTGPTGTNVNDLYLLDRLVTLSDARTLSRPLESSGDRALWRKGVRAGSLTPSWAHVPPGACITTRAYVDTLEAATLTPAEQWARVKQASESDRDRVLEEYRARILSLSIPRDILQALESVLDDIGQAFGHDREVLWAVRSSATMKMVRIALSAGVYRTILGVLVSPSRTPKECWASLWTSAAWAYYQRGEPYVNAPTMAVIVQPCSLPVQQASHTLIIH